MDNQNCQKVCPLCGKPVKVNPGEEKAKVYHMACLEKSMKTVVVDNKDKGE